MGIPQQIIKAVLSGIIEITAGIATLGAIKGFPPEYGMTAAAFILGWGGISVHFQIYGIISEAGLGMRKFVVGKLVHGLLASFMTYMSIKLMMPAAFGSRFQPFGTTACTQFCRDITVFMLLYGSCNIDNVHVHFVP